MFPTKTGSNYPHDNEGFRYGVVDLDPQNANAMQLGYI